ncbi:MAG: DNA polymerase III subunit gamma/tau [Prevotellaceae bacterium]|jgi:DNA polymerase-3 subunit gamma/tau|nr:DNA polymerase III subunit gamma/tau [Prevotellaceae bacterium]
MEQYIVSARKYRPITFASVVGQPSIAATLKNAIERQHLAHAYLFCGPRGVGKTTCARIFAKTINCLNPTPEMEACGECESCQSFSEGRSYSIHELDAASNNSVEDIRTLIEQVRIPPQIGKYSVYIIDEVHMLSPFAFNAFLKTLEEPPAHAIFILATTEKHKILPTILSRCQIFDFNRIRVEDMVSYLDGIVKNEKVICEREALTVIAQKADGAMRDALSIFDQVVAFCGNDVTYTKTIENLNVLDYDYYFRLTDAFLTGDYASALMIFDQVLSKGFEAQHFVLGLSTHFRDLLVCKDDGTVKLLEVGDSIADRYREQSARCSVKFLFEALAIANACDIGYKTSSNTRLHVELCLVKLSQLMGHFEHQPEPVDSKKTEETKVETESSYVAPSVGKAKLSQQINTNRKENSTAIQAKPQSISIGGIGEISSELLKPQEKEADTVEEVESSSFTFDQLQEKWLEFAEQNRKTRPRLANAMVVTAPRLEDETTVVFLVSNEAQKESVEQKLKAELSKFLRQSLRNGNISLDVRIDNEGHVKAPSLYTDEDKLKHLCQKNPTIIELRKELDLDFL